MKKIIVIMAILITGVRDDDPANACPSRMKICKESKKENKAGANFLLLKMQS